MKLKVRFTVRKNGEEIVFEILEQNLESVPERLTALASEDGWKTPNGVAFTMDKYPEMRLFSDPPRIFLRGSLKTADTTPMPHYSFGSAKQCLTALEPVIAAIDEFNGETGGVEVVRV